MKYDVVGIEDLNMKNMARTLHFGKSVADNGWGMFTNMLSYKLAWQGKQLIKIDKWFPSSQLCHVCGYQNKNRWWVVHERMIYYVNIIRDI